jgi:type I restriction enzyme R subunit
MLCEPVKEPKSTEDYLFYFCSQDDDTKEDNRQKDRNRLSLYKMAASYLRTYASLASEMIEAGYSEKEAKEIKEEVEYYEKVREELKLGSGDYIDLKAYEPAMRHLIDSYIEADDSEKISAFDDMSLVEMIVDRGVKAFESLPNGIKKSEKATAETIENNVRKVLVEQTPINPKYYENMSVLFEELIEKRRKGKIKYEEYLKKVVELTKQIQNPETSSKYPVTMDSPAKRALFDNLNSDENLVIKLDSDIRNNKKDDWRGDRIKEKGVRSIIRKHVPDSEVERIFNLVKEQKEY